MDAQREARSLACDLVLHTDRLAELGLHNESPVLERTAGAPLDVERDRGGTHLLYVGLREASRAVVEHGFGDGVVESESAKLAFRITATGVLVRSRPCTERVSARRRVRFAFEDVVGHGSELCLGLRCYSS